MREREAMSNVRGTNSLRRGNLLSKDEPPVLPYATV
jgi:hypothetical protein